MASPATPNFFPNPPPTLPSAKAQGKFKAKQCMGLVAPGRGRDVWDCPGATTGPKSEGLGGILRAIKRTQNDMFLSPALQKLVPNHSTILNTKS